jgi:hypothetical protein
VGREFLVRLLGNGANELHDMYAYALGMHLLWLWAAAGCAMVQVSEKLQTPGHIPPSCAIKTKRR